ncbi:DNA-binding protein HGH1 [Trichodelitschia bisporula]|uniref:Protein HGH1 homolog n=1 Tax=Trichodelitschia bisporula TaxID=703511 RepID=A0A6G1HR48_9PEZI|nr:DNA-binding protein HGH1 [Trichodelitschia bisporula]
MPSELEDLVSFLHHGNAQIRQIAAENLVGYSLSQPALFKTGQLTPIQDLKLLVRDYPLIAKNALDMLINLSDDPEVLGHLAKDDKFLETLLLRITNVKEPHANEIAMLLANLAKHDGIKRVLTLERTPPKALSTSRKAMDQLMDCFVKGAEGTYNAKADFDYLAYFFADMAKHPEGRTYFVTPQAHDSDIIPLTKLTVFTEHKSAIRRRGVASTIKNVTFDVESHPKLFATDEVNLLPYLLLPIMGSEEYDDDDTDGMLDDLQLLPPDKEREKDVEILKTHLETLLILTTTKSGRELLRKIKVYPIIRETHLHAEHEDVHDACDRVVQVLARDEPEEEGEATVSKEVEEMDEDEEIIEV